jgi:hypothetical protein
MLYYLENAEMTECMTCGHSRYKPRTGRVIFGMTPKKNQKDMRGITVLKDGMRWRFGRNSNRHSSRGKYGRHILSTWSQSGSHGAHRSQSGTDNRNLKIHGSVTTHIGGSVLFSAHAKRMVRLILIKYIIN